MPFLSGFWLCSRKLAKNGRGKNDPVVPVPKSFMSMINQRAWFKQYLLDQQKYMHNKSTVLSEGLCHLKGIACSVHNTEIMGSNPDHVEQTVCSLFLKVRFNQNIYRSTTSHIVQSEMFHTGQKSHYIYQPANYCSWYPPLKMSYFQVITPG